MYEILDSFSNLHQLQANIFNFAHFGIRCQFNKRTNFLDLLRGIAMLLFYPNKNSPFRLKNYSNLRRNLQIVIWDLRFDRCDILTSWMISGEGWQSFCQLSLVRLCLSLWNIQLSLCWSVAVTLSSLLWCPVVLAMVSCRTLDYVLSSSLQGG